MKEKQIQSYISPALHKEAKKKAKDKGLSFAAYVRMLIIQDIKPATV